MLSDQLRSDQLRSDQARQDQVRPDQERGVPSALLAPSSGLAGLGDCLWLVGRPARCCSGQASSP